MMNVELPNEKRRRKVPMHFSWIDHRLIREGHFKRCSRDALSLYLFLVCVGDERGVSWYGIDKLCEQLNCEKYELEQYREELIDNGLIAYKKPYYQVLDLSVECYGDEIFNKALKNAVKREKECESKRNNDGHRINIPKLPKIYKDEGDENSIVSLSEVINKMIGKE